MKTRYLPSYTKENFDLFINHMAGRGNKDKRIQLVMGHPWINKTRKTLHYYPTCDFFNLGLTTDQIETLIQYFPERFYYTTGLNVDAGLIKYLGKKYHDKFRLHLSIVTFDPAIRRKMMNPAIDVNTLERICKIAWRPQFFLMYFDKEQFIGDLDILNKYSVNNEGSFYIHKLYYNKLSPNSVKEYSIHGDHSFRSIVQYLKLNDRKLSAISKRSSFAPASVIFAWRFRKELKELFIGCRGGSREAVFCSTGAYPIIKKIMKSMEVIPIENAIGGCVDFTLGMTVRSIIMKLRELFENGIILRRMYLPGSMFAVHNQYDLNGDSVEDIKNEFPGLKITVIHIPQNILRSTLSLNTCYRYYQSHEVNHHDDEAY